MEQKFLKIVCIDESDPMEYRILEEANRGNLQEVHEFIKERYDKHKGAKWMMLPFVCKVN